MEYHVVIYKDFNNISVKSYETRELAERKLQKKYSDAKFKAKIVAVPEIRCGLRLIKNGFYYKTILKSTKNLYYLDNTEKNNFGYDSSDPTNKNKIFEWFIKGMLDDGIEDYDQNYEDNDWVDDGEDEDIEKLIEEELAENC